MRRVRHEGGYTVIDLQVRLTADDVAALREALPSDHTEAAGRIADSDPDFASFDKSARDHAAQLLAFRRRRDRELGSDLFADPAWDILLDLFIHHVDGKPITVSSVCYGACVPPTTALRYIATLASTSLVAKRASKTDGRVIYVELTAEALGRLRKLLSR